MAAKNLKSDPIKTVLVITVGMLIVYLITKWKAAIYISVIVGLAGVFSTYLAKKIDFVWLKLTWLLSQIVPNILLSIVFYLFLTPIALFSRLFNSKNKVVIKNSKESLCLDGAPVLNAALGPDALDEVAPLRGEARNVLERAARRDHLSSRALQSARRVARTAADLRGAADVGPPDDVVGDLRKPFIPFNLLFLCFVQKMGADCTVCYSL